MQVSVENVGTLERRLKVSVPAENFVGAVSTRLREIARTVRIKGFRQGKVPAKVIEQRYGDQVRNEVLSDLISRTFSEALQKENLRPAGQPDIETDGSTDDGAFSYTATFEIVPDFGTIDVSTLKINRASASIGDADIDQMIDTLRQQRRTWEPVERAAKGGDLVSLEMVATAGELRVPAEGVDRGTTVIGSGVLFPAIEAELEGMAADGSKTVEVEFPADWRVESLAGKSASVELKVLRVAEPKVPEVDADFVESFGIQGGDMETFRKEVRSNLERELRGALMNRLRAEVIDRLVAAHESTELPQRLIAAEAAGMARQAERQATEQGQKDVRIADDTFLTQARKRVAAGLLVSELARQNEIRLDPKRLNETLQLIASTYEEPQQVIDLYRQDQRLMQSLQSRVMEEQVVEWIADHADVTVQEMSFQDVMRPGQ
ncbi:MAG: trigger factor [Lysobacteraceae bacterium]